MYLNINEKILKHIIKKLNKKTKFKKKIKL